MAAHNSSSPMKKPAGTVLGTFSPAHGQLKSPEGVLVSLSTMVRAVPLRQTLLEKGAVHLGMTRDASCQTLLGGGLGESAAEQLLEADLWALQQGEEVDEADAEVAAMAKQRRKKVASLDPNCALAARQEYLSPCCLAMQVAPIKITSRTIGCEASFDLDKLPWKEDAWGCFPLEGSTRQNLIALIEWCVVRSTPFANPASRVCAAYESA